MPDPNQPSESEGISLDELAAAFADAMRGAMDAARPPIARESPPFAAIDDEAEKRSSGEAQAATCAESATPDNDASEVSPHSILEAMLFVGNRAGNPLTPQRAAELMRGVEPAEIADLVGQLNERYNACGCPYRIVSEGAGYRMSLRGKFAAIRNVLYGRNREARLSQAAVDVLAIIAYRQPISAEDVSKLRGFPSGHLLTQLVRRRLLEVQRSPESPRTPVYSTTARFLQLFGLEDLGDLPQSEDLDVQ